MKLILSIDGGGALGAIPLTVLKNIENRLNKKLCEVFDLIIGSSIGAVIGGVLSTGKITGEKFHKKFLVDLPYIFKKRIRIPILHPMYDRNEVKQSIRARIGDSYMRECNSKFMCTSINYVDGKTHFFKSWENKDGDLKMTDALLRSSAAPLYFGKIVDFVNRAVWVDGGCGNLNNPAMQGYIEALRQEWLPEERVHLLSIGCGQTSKGVSFDKSRKFNNIKEVGYYFDLDDGGLARTQMSMMQDIWLKSFSKSFSKFTTQRIQYYDLPKGVNRSDNVRDLNKFVEIGTQLSKEVDYTYLRT